MPGKITGPLYRALREKAELTQADVAYGLGYVTPQYISNMERGLCMLPDEKIPKAAALLKCKPQVLVDIKLKRTEIVLRKALNGKKR